VVGEGAEGGAGAASFGLSGGGSEGWKRGGQGAGRGLVEESLLGPFAGRRLDRPGDLDVAVRVTLSPRGRLRLKRPRFARARAALCLRNPLGVLFPAR